MYELTCVPTTPALGSRCLYREETGTETLQLALGDGSELPECQVPGSGHLLLQAAHPDTAFTRE